MKHGDQVNTPNGIGIYFDTTKDNDKAYVRLKNPTELKKWIPLIEVGHPVWECFPCDAFDIKDLTLMKTLEDRQKEAQIAARVAQAQQQARMQEAMRQHQEAQRRVYEQQTNNSKNTNE